MMIKFFLSIIMLVCASVTTAQNLSKDYIDGWVAQYNYKTPEAINGYIINGLFYPQADSVKISSILSGWPKDKLLGIMFFKTDELLPTTRVPGKLVVAITSKGNQKLKEKGRLLKSALNKFGKPVISTSHININSTDPVLFIDDKQIFHADCFKELSKIKARKIYAIHITEYPLPEKYYGQNAKNGMVQVWLSKTKITTR